MLLDNNFPDVEEANEDGLLAIGGNLNTSTIISAYKQGIFPWYNPQEPILWYSPNPRCVLYPANVYISKSMKKVMQKKHF